MTTISTKTHPYFIRKNNIEKGISLMKDLLKLNTDDICKRIFNQQLAILIINNEIRICTKIDKEYSNYENGIKKIKLIRLLKFFERGLSLLNIAMMNDDNEKGQNRIDKFLQKYNYEGIVIFNDMDVNDVYQNTIEHIRKYTLAYQL